VNVNIYNQACPLSILKTFLSDDLIEGIAEHGNKYAQLVKELPEVQEQMDTTQQSLFSLWKDLTVDEL